MKPNPKVTIGIPVYNGALFLREAIESALAQTYMDFEVVIADNASTDSTPDICQEYIQRDVRIRYFRNSENIGASGNYRLVFERARGEYFCWLPSDEAMMPRYLEKLVRVLDEESDVVLAFPQYLWRRDSQPPQPHVESRNGDLRHDAAGDRLWKYFREEMVGPNWPIFGLYRRSILAQTELIRPIIGADDFLTVDVILRGKAAQIPEDLYILRSHEGAWHRQRVNKATGLAGLLGVETGWAAAWFDPSNERIRVVFPHWRRLWEFFLLIARCPELTVNKLAMTRVLPLYAWHHWKRMTKELAAGLAQAIGLPVGAIIRRVKRFL